MGVRGDPPALTPPFGHPAPAPAGEGTGVRGHPSPARAGEGAGVTAEGPGDCPRGLLCARVRVRRG